MTFNCFKKYTLKGLLFLLISTLICACTWVKPSDESLSVSFAEPDVTKSCKKLADTTVIVKDRVGIIDRKEKVVVTELITLAKNEAAKIGGDTVSTQQPRNDDGEQVFSIFKCR